MDELLGLAGCAFSVLAFALAGFMLVSALVWIGGWWLVMGLIGFLILASAVMLAMSVMGDGA